jgi:hypothetical protein
MNAKIEPYEMYQLPRKFEPKVFLQKHCANCKTAERKKYQSAKMAKTEKSKPKAIQRFCKGNRRPQIHGTTNCVSRKEGKPNLPDNKWSSTEIHHTYCGKDRANYLDESTWIAVSRDGHNWIHDNPKEAREIFKKKKEPINEY